MEAVAEQIVSIYLTRGEKVFIVPQYNITIPGQSGEWSCPDFVALDFSRKEVVVVEVTTGADIKSVTPHAIDRERQWFGPLRKSLTEDKVVMEWGAKRWSIRFLGFVRRASLEAALRRVVGHEDVAFKAIEDVTFTWEYWSDRVNNGLPR